MEDEVFVVVYCCVEALVVGDFEVLRVFHYFVLCWFIYCGEVFDCDVYVVGNMCLDFVWCL